MPKRKHPYRGLGTNPPEGPGNAGAADTEAGFSAEFDSDLGADFDSELSADYGADFSADVLTAGGEEDSPV